MREVEALLAYTLPIAKPEILTHRTVDLLDDLWTEVFEFYFAPDDEIRSGPHMASEALFLSRTCKRWLVCVIALRTYIYTSLTQSCRGL
jgi:hypothetical protein